MSSKVSKDSDCSLVSSKNFSEILPSNSWHPGPGKVGQGGVKVLHLWRQICISQAKIFLRVQTRRLAASFDASTRSIALTDREKFPRKATCVSVFFSKIPKSARVPKWKNKTKSGFYDLWIANYKNFMVFTLPRFSNPRLHRWCWGQLHRN